MLLSITNLQNQGHQEPDTFSLSFWKVAIFRSELFYFGFPIFLIWLKWCKRQYAVRMVFWHLGEPVAICWQKTECPVRAGNFLWGNWTRPIDMNY